MSLDFLFNSKTLAFCDQLSAYGVNRASCIQERVQNPVKRLTGSFLRKYVMAESCHLFSQKAPS